MIGTLIYKKAIYDTEHFDAGKVYLYIGKSDLNNNTGKYIGNSGFILHVGNNNFYESYRAIEPIKNVICIFPGKDEYLTAHEQYSVYMASSTSKNGNASPLYTVINDSYSRVEYSKHYFVDMDKYETLKQDRLLDKFIEDKIKVIIEEEEKYAILMFKEDEKNTKLEYEKQLVRTTINLVTNKSINIGRHDALKQSNKSKNVFKRLLEALASPKEEFSSVSTKTSINLEKLNTLPVYSLGKIKIIENNIEILMAMDIHIDIVKLIQESIDLSTVLLAFNPNKDTENKLDEFLNRTIKYCDSLKSSKDLERNYIERKLAENINDAIDRNSELLGKMVGDNHMVDKQWI